METMKKPDFTYNDIYDTIREYHWMIKELERLRKQFVSFDAAKAAASGPRNKRMLEKIERAERFEKRIDFINANRCIASERDRVILDCLLDGMQHKDIAANLGLNPKTIERIRNRIIEAIFESQNV